MKKLNEIEIATQLQQLDGWEYSNNMIHTTIEFKDFKDTFSVMTRIAFEAELQGHHPNWTNVYNKLEISLQTHDVEGITEKDFKLATVIDQIILGDD